jgi:CrcB protein
VATLTVNVVGGLLIGLLAGGQHLSQELRGLLVVGVLGGFTTFSAFSWDTAGLATGGHPRCALLNVGLTVCLTLAGTWVGMRLRGNGG